MEPRSQMRGRPLSPPPFWFVCPVFCMGSSVRKYARAKKIHSNRYGGLERCCLLARKDTRLATQHSPRRKRAISHAFRNVPRGFCCFVCFGA
jgi:hypothetical protein